MTEATRVYGPYIYNDEVTLAGGVWLPPDCVNQDNIAPGAELPADKMVHRHAINFGQDDGIDAVAGTLMLHMVDAASAIQTLRIRPGALPSGGDKVTTIDVQKAANGNASWTSILTAPITFAVGDIAATMKAGTLVGPATLVADDALRVVVTVSGTTGTQLKGWHATLLVDENPI